MTFNMEFFQSIEDQGLAKLNEEQSIRVNTVETIEDDFGTLGYIVSVELHDTRDEEYPDEKCAKYFLKPEESNYYAFIMTYKMICESMNINPVNWE